MMKMMILSKSLIMYMQKTLISKDVSSNFNFFIISGSLLQRHPSPEMLWWFLSIYCYSVLSQNILGGNNSSVCSRLFPDMDRR